MTTASICPRCKGSGEIESVAYFPDGSDFDAIKACPDCKGEGSEIFDESEWDYTEVE
jgi:DnaJ-class molecular chaperone